MDGGKAVRLIVGFLIAATISWALYGTAPAPYGVMLREVGVLEGPGRGLTFLGIHDLNGDGFADLVVGGDRRVRVFFGDGRGGFSPGPWVYLETEEYKEGQELPGRFVTEAGGHRWKPYEVEEKGGKAFVPLEVLVDGGALVDLDGDGELDLVVRGFCLDCGGDKLYLLRGLGGGRFAVISELAYPQSQIYSELWPVRDGVIFAAAETLDKPTRIYRLRAPQLRHPLLEEIVRGEWSLEWVGDLNGDGVSDLLISTEDGLRFLMGEAGGGFHEGPLFSPVTGEMHMVKVVDLNGDGFPNLVLLTRTGFTTVLWQGEGYKEAFSRDLGMDLAQMAVADLTGDGIPDLLVQRATGFWEYLLLPGDGKGGFRGPVAEFVVPGGAGMKPNFADLNGDGLLDIVFSSFLGGGGKLRVYLNGTTHPGRSLHPLSGPLLAVGDLSGDGRPDVLVADRHGAAVFWNEGGFIRRPLASLGRVPLAGAISHGRAFLFLPGTERFPDEVVAVDANGKVVRRWRVSEDSLPDFAVADLNGNGIGDPVLPAKRRLLVIWDGRRLKSYAWPKGEISLVAAASGRLWGVAIGKYANLVEIRFEGGRLKVSPPLLSLEILPLSMTAGDLDGDGIPDPVVLGAELGVKEEEGEKVVFPQRVVAGLGLSKSGPVTEEVPNFPEEDFPWPFLGVAVGRIAGVPHLFYTTSAGGGLFVVPWKGGFGEPVRFDLPAGPVLAADLDGNGDSEALSSTSGLTLLAIIWNGGGR